MQAPTTVGRHNDPQNNLTVMPGSQMLFKRGDVFESALIPQYDGEAEHPITYGCYGTGPLPVFTGMRTLSSSAWRPEGNGVYSVPFPFYYLHLTIQLDGMMVYMGKWPREQQWAPYEAGGQGYINGSGVSQIPFPIVKNNARLRSRKNRYIIDDNLIQQLAGANLQYLGDYGYGNSLQYGNDPDGGFYISNHIETLLGLGNWFYDYDPTNLSNTANNRLYMHFGGGTPDQHTVKAGVDFYNMDVIGRKFLTVQEMAFDGADITGVRVGTNTSDQDHPENWIRSQVIVLQGLEMRNQGGNGMAVNGDSITIDGNIVTKADNNGIDASDCTDLTIQNNKVQNCGMVPGEGRSADLSYIGISVNHSDNPLIQANKVENIGYDGISVTSKYGCRILNNRVKGTCWKKDDGGGIYMVDPTNEGAATEKLVQGNTVLETRGAPDFVYTGGEDQEKSYAIYGDNFLSGMKVLDNILINNNNGSSGVLINGGRDCEVQRNKVFGYFQAQLILNKRNYPNGQVANIGNNLVKGNTFVSNNATQRMVFCYGNSTDNPKDWADFQDNTYASPLNPAQAFTVTWQSDRSFDSWKTFTGKEQGSKEEEIATSTPSNIFAVYNETPEGKTIILPGIGKKVGLAGTSTTVQLEPYSAAFFIKVSLKLTTDVDGKLVTGQDGKLFSTITPV